MVGRPGTTWLDGADYMPVGVWRLVSQGTTRGLMVNTWQGCLRRRTHPFHGGYVGGSSPRSPGSVTSREWLCSGSPCKGPMPSGACGSPPSVRARELVVSQAFPYYVGGLSRSLRLAPEVPSLSRRFSCGPWDSLRCRAWGERRNARRYCLLPAPAGGEGENLQLRNSC